MKTIINYIKEGLKISSKTKVDKVGAEKIAKILDIDLKYAKEIHNKYLKMNLLEMNKDFEKDLVSVSATQFELIFMLCAMLIKDKQDKLDPAFTVLGKKSYKLKFGTQNPYNYSLFKEEFEDEDGNIWNILEYIQEQYITRKEVEKNIQDVFKLCIEANINDPEKIYNFYEKYN